MKILFFILLFPFFLMSCLSQEAIDKKNDEIKNFAKIYGLVRFFDPSPENENVNWDVFLISSLNKIIREKRVDSKLYSVLFSEVSGNTVVSNNIIEGKAESISNDCIRWQYIGLGNANKNDVYTCLRVNVNKLDYPIYDTCYYKLFDDDSCLNSFINERIDEHLYVNISTVVSKENYIKRKNFKNINSQYKTYFPEININDTTTVNRLACCIDIWNAIKHFYPYREKLANWDSKLDSLIEIGMRNQPFSKFLLSLKRIYYSINDGHAAISERVTKNIFLPPISWTFINDTLIIDNVFCNSTLLKIGDIVLSIDKVNSSKTIHEKENIVSAGTNKYKQYLAAFGCLKGEENSSLSIDVLRGTKIIANIPIKRNVPLIKYFTEYINSNPAIQEIEKDLIYINFSKILDSQLDSVLKNINNYKAIIFDYRGYPRGSNNLLSHLIKINDTTTNWMKIPKIIGPNYKTCGYQEISWGLKPELPNIGSKVYAIIDSKIISYGESIIGYLSHYKLATLIGEKTAGTNGNYNKLNLPCNLSFSFTGAIVTKLNGEPLDCHGFVPDVEINYTIQGVKNGVDELKEKTIEYAKSNNK